MIDDEQAKYIKEQILKQLETQTQIPEDKKESLKKYISSLDNVQLEEFLIKNNMMGPNGQAGSEEGNEKQEPTTKTGTSTKSTTKECIMCMLSSRKIESLALYEDKDYLAALEINPFTNGHAILIPKKHISETKNLHSKAFTIANKIGKHLVKKLKAENFQINSSNEIGHAIVNIIPLYKDQILDYKRKPGEKKALQELAMKIGFIESKKQAPRKKVEKKEVKDTQTSSKSPEKPSNIIKLPRRIP